MMHLVLDYAIAPLYCVGDPANCEGSCNGQSPWCGGMLKTP